MNKFSKIFLTLVISIFVVAIGLSQRNYLKHRQPSVIGVAKQVYTKQRAVPKKYHEMKQMLEDFKRFQDWNTLVEMGDVYARGFFPYLLPNKEMAIACYEVATTCPDPIARGNAQAKITSMTDSPLSEQDQKGDGISTTYGISLVKIASQVQKSLDKLKQQQPPDHRPTELEVRNSKRRREANKANLRQTKNTRNTRPTRNIARRLGRLGGGSQNTHDHGVTSATKTNIKNLADDFKSSGKSFRQDNVVLDEAIQLCKDSVVSKDEVADAHHVIVSLSPDEYSGTGVSQIQILDMVLWKISTISDTSIKSNMRETLCKRLASGFENGIVVCGTGKVSRIVSVFEGVLDKAQKSVSINLVEKEIAQLAAKIRHDFLQSVGPIGQKAYQTANSVPEYSKTMSDSLRRTVREEYVEKLNMKESVINPLIEAYASAY